MLTHPTLDLLHQLGLAGMAKAFGEIEASGEAAALTHPDWLALLLDQEASYRRDRRLHALPRRARPRPRAVPKAHRRQLDRCARELDPVRADRAGDMIQYLPTLLIFQDSLPRVG